MEAELCKKYKKPEISDLAFGSFMQQLDSLMYAYFHFEENCSKGCYVCAWSGILDEKEEWVDTTIVLTEQKTQVGLTQQKLQIQCCNCCDQAITTQTNGIWACWYCSRQNASQYIHICPLYHYLCNDLALLVVKYNHVEEGGPTKMVPSARA